MKRIAPFGRLAAVFAGFCLMLGVAVASDPVSSDKRLPSDTLMYFSIRNISEFKDKFQETQFGKLLKDEAMKEFLDQFKAPLEAISGEVEEKTGSSFKELLKIPSGELSIALTQSEQGPVSVVLTLGYGESEEALKKLIAKGVKAAEDEGAASTEEEVDGVQIVTVGKKKDDDSDDKESEGVANLEKSFSSVSYAMKDSTLLVSNQASAIKGILERWDGGSDSTLANAASYKTILEKCSPKGDDTPEIVWFVDPIKIVTSFVTLGAAENPQMGMVIGFLPVLGLDQLKGVGGAMNVNEGDFDNVNRSFINVELPPRGAMRVFSMPAIEQTPAKWVHDKSSMFLSMNCDFKEAYSAVESLVNTFLGEGALSKQVEDLAENEDGPKIHIKKDVIDQITGLITVAGDVQEDDDGSQERYIVAFELTNEETFKKVLAKAAKYPGFPGKAREFKGNMIYEFGDDSEEEESESEEQSFRNLGADEGDENEDGEMEEIAMTPALAVARNHLFIATDVEQLEQILRGKDEDSLAESKTFKKVSKYFPAKVSSMSFQRADAQVKAALEALKSGQLDAIVGDKIDLSKLPDFDDIKQYFTPTGGYVIPDEQGVFMENFNLKGE